jgi:hypothetical protein
MSNISLINGLHKEKYCVTSEFVCNSNPNGTFLIVLIYNLVVRESINNV